ncbi:MAG: PAS domain-containing protein [Candidatus Pacebacteria bacterium]|nr:PAS domain-containing protein [Candidatus Paceibacterota bacterium]
MNFVERTLSIMYSLSVLMLYVPEVTTLRISGLFGLVLVWTPVILWALWTIYSGYHTLPRTDDEKLLRISANVESDNDGVRAIYEFHRVISNLSQHECRMWIEGYMPMHVEKCAAGENCGLCHYYKKLYSESRKAKVKMGETVAIERKVLDVFKKALIRNLLKVFPRSTELKLAYLFFADSHDHKDQSYIKKITSGDQRNLVLRFALARYESKHKERKSAIERMKNERQAILEVAELLNQFWELFEGDNPEVREVYEIGKRAFEGLELLKRIEKERVAEGIEDTTGAHALYRQLMHDVFLESTEKDAHDVSVDVKHSEEKAWMRFSTKEKYMGTILECNQAFSRLLGYSKSDLIGKSISTLIPRLYLKAEQRLRQSIMDVYWKPAGSDSGTALSAFAKHRSEYVFPIKLVVEKWASAFSSPDMMVSMDIEKKNFNSKVVYFLTDRELVIDSCSSSKFPPS